MKQIKIISATKYSSLELDKLLIWKTCLKSRLMDKTVEIPMFEHKIVFNNSEALSVVYNREIKKEEHKDKILVFVHDDVIIEDLFLKEKLNEAMKQFDVVGLVGIEAPITLKDPALWHLMGSRSQYSGAVSHFEKNDSRSFITLFGPAPKRVVLLDGLFIAINTERILEKGVLFDEKNPAKFHYYDLNFCLDANKLGLKLGTWPICAIHKSHGLEVRTKDWEDGQNYFLKKWS